MLKNLKRCSENWGLYEWVVFMFLSFLFSAGLLAIATPAVVAIITTLGT